MLATTVYVDAKAAIHWPQPGIKAKINFIGKGLTKDSKVRKKACPEVAESVGNPTGKYQATK